MVKLENIIDKICIKSELNIVSACDILCTERIVRHLDCVKEWRVLTMLKPVTKVAMYKDIVNQIMSMIKSGIWQPGTCIPTEVELAKTFNVSRNSIREALKSLAYSGILSSRAGQGTFVTADAMQKIENLELIDFISRKASVDDLTETRLLLETELARLAALRATDEDKIELQALQQQFELQMNYQKAVNDFSNPTEIGIDFHMRIAKIAKNHVLMKLIQSIQGELHEQRRRLEYHNALTLDLRLQEHKAICEAVLDNDPDRAAAAMRTHIQHSFESIKADNK